MSRLTLTNFIISSVHLVAVGVVYSFPFSTAPSSNWVYLMTASWKRPGALRDPGRALEGFFLIAAASVGHSPLCGNFRHKHKKYC